MNGQVLVKFEKQATAILNQVFYQTSHALSVAKEKKLNALIATKLHPSGAKSALITNGKAVEKFYKMTSKNESEREKLAMKHREMRDAYNEKLDAIERALSKKHDAAEDKARDAISKSENKMLADLGFVAAVHKPRRYGVYNEPTANQTQILLRDIVSEKEMQKLGIKQLLLSSDVRYLELNGVIQDGAQASVDALFKGRLKEYQKLNDDIVDLLQGLWASEDNEDFHKRLTALNKKKRQIAALADSVQDGVKFNTSYEQIPVV